MAAPARIVDLRQRYTENPKRFFAPLANEYRKVGDLDQAIGLCRQHLLDAPLNLSGQIVFGLALFEAGGYTEARAAFLSAVAIDPENLIAVRHLGDIARLGNELDAAVEWYQRLLDLDPRSAEPADLLREAREARGAGVSPVDGPDSPAATGPVADQIAPPVPATQSETEPPPPVAAVPTRNTFDDDAPFEIERAFELPPVPVGPDIAEPMATLVADDVPVDWGAPVADGFDPFAPAPAVPEVDFGLVDPDRVSGSVALGADDALIPDDWATWGDVVPTEGAGAASDVLPPSFGSEPVFEPDLPEPTFESDPPESDPPAPFATETMAALYLRQGLRSEAVAVYRQLLERRPDDAVLRARLAEIEAPRASVPLEGASRTARAVFAGLAARRPQPPTRRSVPRPSMGSLDEQRAHLLAAAFAAPHAGASASAALGTATSLDPGRADDNFQDWLSGLTGS